MTHYIHEKENDMTYYIHEIHTKSRPTMSYMIWNRQHCNAVMARNRCQYDALWSWKRTFYWYITDMIMRGYIKDGKGQSALQPH